MRILKHSEIDKKKWDAMILRSSVPLVFAQSFYLDETSPGWDAIVEGDYKSGMPLTWKRKFGVLYLIQPPFTPQLGVFGNHNEASVSEMLNIIQKEYKYVSIELNASLTYKLPHTKDKRTFAIDFKNKYQYNSNTKRNIQKSIKNDLSVHLIEEEEAMKLSKIFLYPFLKKRLNLKPADIIVFGKLLNGAYEKKYAKTFIVRNGKEDLLAIAHFISNGKHAVYLKGLNFDKNSGSMHFLMHEVIEQYKNAGLKLFDFGGGQNESLAQFYAGFGAKELKYKIYKINNLPRAIKWMKK